MRRVALLLIVSVFTFGFIINGCAKKSEDNGAREVKGSVPYWTCGMHPSVRVTDEEYNRGKKNCPICGMNLIPATGRAVTKGPAATDALKGTYYGCGVKEEGHCSHCDEGKADAKCICGGH